jgi:plastocyanin domain-containing protein
MLDLDLTDWMVIAGGLVAIAWVNWYFFLAERLTATAAQTAAVGATDSIAEATITVDGGYAPSTVRVKAGRPVRLIFDRRDNSSCSEEIVLPDFGIRKFLPSGQRTMVELTPPATGTYDFMCGMSMLRGRLIAEA